MFKIGTVCVKIAGRDAGKQCVVVEAPKDGFVVIEGETRRRKCNVRHLESLDKTVEVKSGATHDVVMKALGIEPRKSKARKAGTKPLKHTSRKKPAPKEAPAAKKVK